MDYGPAVHQFLVYFKSQRECNIANILQLDFCVNLNNVQGFVLVLGNLHDGIICLTLLLTMREENTIDQQLKRPVTLLGKAKNFIVNITCPALLTKINKLRIMHFPINMFCMMN